MAITKEEYLDAERRLIACNDLIYNKKDEPAVKVTVSTAQPTDGSHWIKPAS
jgi:hypothetical protein